MEFSLEQQLAYNKYIEGENIFITGPGGTGKTALIHHIQKDAYKKGIDVQVCALTGCAAVLLECKAKTIHSWAGIRLGNGSIAENVDKIMKNRYAKATWKGVDILIIDEVSMMSAKLFEMLDAIAKAVRRNHRPFGGIQVIFSGDFYQLPPVGDKDEPETGKFCFESLLWFEMFKLTNHVILCKIFRQNDPIYQKILCEIREGRLKRSSNETLLQLVGREIDPNSPIRPTKLFPTRNKVDYINVTEMSNLKGEEYIFNIKYVKDLEMSANEKLQRMNYSQEQINAELMYLQGNLRCDPTLTLKIGAQVMCIVNLQLDNGDILCNGAQGVVIDIGAEGFPVVLYNNGYKMRMHPHSWASEHIPGIGVSQIPLILAWALTIHKAQGATLDVAEVDAGSGIFECGQTYVALSRIKSLKGLYLCSFDAKRVRINSKVQTFYARLDEFYARLDIPIVEATTIEETSDKVDTNIPIVEASLVYGKTQTPPLVSL